jgi:hypothetical protein
MTAASIAKALGGHRAGATWIARLFGNPAGCSIPAPCLTGPAARGPRRLPIASRHPGADFDAMATTVREGAKWTVEEGNTASPTFRLWRPFFRPDIEPSIRFDERSAPDTGQGVERTREGRASC